MAEVDQKLKSERISLKWIETLMEPGITSSTLVDAVSDWSIIT
jgi:hypothetical protein